MADPVTVTTGDLRMPDLTSKFSVEIIKNKESRGYGDPPNYQLEDLAYPVTITSGDLRMKDLTSKIGAEINKSKESEGDNIFE